MSSINVSSLRRVDPALACLLFLIALFTTHLSAQDAAKRPRITGISHVGYFVSDLPKSVAFWHDFLGYDEAYDLKKKDGSGVRIAFIKLNDHQHIELFNEPPTVPGNMMSHLCFTVDNIEQMRAYLISQGFAVKPSSGKTRTGDYAFEIKDPDGMLVEFVQSLPDGMEAHAAGKFLPDTRISSKIMHLGFLVGNSQKSLDFYGKVLGFQETWRGGPDPKELSWINMRVPDGTDYVEFMLYRTLPPQSAWGGKNHISLEVPDVPKAVEILEARPAFKVYGKPLKVNIGINGKRQVNIFDPDGTRVELMEPTTASGKPVPPSTAPPPPPSHD
jgi:catechol 2,3-dioxygenase-like lactoylglutathione lyase family enzyme